MIVNFFHFVDIIIEAQEEWKTKTSTAFYKKESTSHLQRRTYFTPHRHLKGEFIWLLKPLRKLLKKNEN